MKVDSFVEIFLWNKNVDSLVRVLQRMEALGIWSKQEMAHYEARLEEHRASFNACFAETIAAKERLDEHRLQSVRLAAESQNSLAVHIAKQSKQTNQRNH
jgi:hypothetical protein